jgi:nucleotide-binding universal stress UspA family protein
VAADVVDAAGPHGLVVMPATDGDRAPALLGSTVADVVETASGPVVLVGPRVVAGGLRGTVIVACIGDDATAQLTVGLARYWARHLDLQVRLARVGEDRRTAVLVGALEQAGRAGAWHIVDERDPARALAGIAGEVGAALLVIPTRLHVGWRLPWPDTVTVATVGRAPCPGVVVPGGPAARSAAGGSAGTAGRRVAGAPVERAPRFAPDSRTPAAPR